jgi:5-methylcytosine-specific restriction endonuclease McrA
MAFSTTTKQAALRRSGGRCECRRVTHKHPSVRCSRTVTMTTAHFHHRSAQAVGGHDGFSNCEVLCVPCHQATASYGRR